MIPVEGVESTKYSPTSAQMLIGVLKEAADIGAGLNYVSETLRCDQINLPLELGRSKQIGVGDESK